MRAFPTCSTAWAGPTDRAAACRVGPSLRCGLRASRARAKETAIKLLVKVVPASSRNGIAGWLGERLKVRVSAPAERGRANEAVEATLAEALGVARDRVRVVGGKSSPRKVVEVRGLSESEVYSRLPNGV